MIVLAIIGILAATIIPNAIAYKTKQNTKYKSRMDDTEEVSHTPHVDHYSSKSNTDDYDLQSRYVMVIHYNTDEFTKRVNYYMERGYTLHGIPVQYNNRIIQILLKP
jgi:hypothetical protein